MDPRRYMIVDTEYRGEPRMFVTKKVQSISVRENMYVVMFTGATRPYTYRKGRMLCMTDPERIDLSERQLYSDNRHLTDIAEAYRFNQGGDTFWFVVKTNGAELSLDGRRVYLTRTAIHMTNPSTWDYLKHVAAETGLRNDEDENLLVRQYDWVDLYRDDVPLAAWLDSRRSLQSFRRPRTIFYPFGCNASQKQAVEEALSHQVSIIQGPPGTGKTQTILNIIANLVMAGKKVLVVSNNNSAVDNVAEKLASPQVGLDFLVAKLGSAENKERFIEGQKPYPAMESWQVYNPSILERRVGEMVEEVSDTFDKQTRLARLRLELNDLTTEAHYNESPESSVQPLLDALNGKSSVKIMQLLHRYTRLLEQERQPGLFFKLRWVWHLGLAVWSLFEYDGTTVVDVLRKTYYTTRREELETEIARLEQELQEVDPKALMETLRRDSLDCWRHRVAEEYGTRQRTFFYSKNLSADTARFLREYPIVLSTTYSAKSCISPDFVFDYVIMDEASQVDVVTGALALSCARNAVIVGDDKQLPNVIESRLLQVLKDMETAAGVAPPYRTTENSFLQSCVRLFAQAPVTLLQEHYRCHPRIIEFCNRRFYDGRLIAMTSDSGEPDVLKVVRTVPGNHARGHYNQREIDVIREEVLPAFSTESTVGIITPYRKQGEEINRQLGCDIASTVHKYQGRECDGIVISMVDNQVSSFSDDPNLLNVAISRAKSRLCIVVTGNELSPDSNIAQLVEYVRYHNYEVGESKLRSVFDLLYKTYTQERLAFEKAHSSGNDDPLSESIMYDLLSQVLKQMPQTRQADILCHYPLSRLVTQNDTLSPDESSFVASPLSHVDFLVYNTITKRPLFCVEVDGWQYHQKAAQQERDGMKDRILMTSGLSVIRLATNETVTADRLKSRIVALFP